MNSPLEQLTGELALRPLIISILDWAAVGLLLYLAFQLVRQTRTVWLIRGFLILSGAFFLSNLLGLTTLNFILDKILIGVAVAIPVIFQPELRRFLEQLGRGEIFSLLRPDRSPDFEQTALDQLLEAVRDLSEERIGALIVLEKSPIDERLLQDPGDTMDAVLSKSLLLTIFYPKTRLHDGAVLIRNWRVEAASVILPMSTQIPARQLGTRHRAAMGITEQTDALCVVVSEETGSISLAERGKLQRPLSVEQLAETLHRRYRRAETTSVFQIPALGDWTRKFFPASSSQSGNSE
ncbi:diadenylate cyclase CdaA [Gloeobacter kilaueensis]|uniref:Diadenylate cyclase n=1 Tax=Gloeobacter kilaueensis (strain ATCC BAA-2537 / CCAP 1431/1 / ULC 316 / JS1) TaxID=1183438 RepID=U5QLR5_GLOK1|nr:diadenylate cyclase CdaA [Gloeobacter kilaueensis]AGY59846.1 hypothetical protein GKIL_3600 [Gloeobacter kilaueensis JS1]